MIMIMMVMVMMRLAGRIDDCKEQNGHEIRNTKYSLPVYGDAGCGFLCQVEQRFLVNCSPSDGNDGQ